MLVGGCLPLKWPYSRRGFQLPAALACFANKKTVMTQDLRTAPARSTSLSLRLQHQRRFRQGMDAGFLWDEVHARMLERMQWVRRQPEQILVLGDSHLRDALSLQKTYPSSSVTVLDWCWTQGALPGLAPAPDAHEERSKLLSWTKRVFGALLERKRTFEGGSQWSLAELPGDVPLRVAADAHELPFRAACFDLIWSNGLLHWSSDWPRLLAELKGATKADALFSFSLLGVDSLAALRPLMPDLMYFPDMHDLGDALVHAGWAEPVVDMERMLLTWRQPDDLLRDLRALGGHSSPNRAKFLRSRRWLKSVYEALEPLRAHDGLYKLELELILGHAWRTPDLGQSEDWQPLHFKPKRDSGRQESDTP